MKKIALIGKGCVACGQCVKICSMNAIAIHKGVYATVSGKCVGCGKCMKACSAGVIELKETEAEINEEALV